MSNKVFISYSSHEKDDAFSVCEGLEALGIDCWIAPRDILPGSSWGEAIIDGLNSCKVMVLLFSEASNSSNQVLREVERCVAKGIPVIPLRLDATSPSKSFEYFLSSSHWMEGQTRPLAPLIPQLVDTVQKLIADQSSQPLPKQPTQTMPASTSRRNLIITSTFLSALGVGGFGYWRLKGGGMPLDSSAVAVLPFKNLNNDAQVDFLKLAIASELDSQIANLEKAIVRPLDSVRSVVAEPVDSNQVARALQVGTLVMGSFWNVGKQIRLSVNLVDADQNRQVWADTFNGSLDGLLGLFDTMVPKVIDAISQRLGTSTSTQIDQASNPQAYELYLRAKSLAFEITRENNAQALDLLNQALTLDAQFARAHAALAQAQVTQYYWNFSNSKEWLNKARDRAQTALTLNPKLPEAHNALAFAYEGMGQRAQAANAFLNNTNLSTNYAPGLKNAGRWLFYMGDFKASLRVLEQADKLDPLNANTMRKAMCHFFSGNQAEARRLNRIAQTKAKGVDQLTLVAFLWAWLGDYEQSKAVLTRLQGLDPDAFSIQEIKAWLAALTGDRRLALNQIRLLERRESFGIYDEIACLYAILGMQRKAVAWLDKAVSMGAPNLAWYESDFCHSIRQDPRYKQLMGQLRREYEPLLRDFHNRSTGSTI